MGSTETAAPSPAARAGNRMPAAVDPPPLEAPKPSASPPRTDTEAAAAGRAPPEDAATAAARSSASASKALTASWRFKPAAASEGAGASPASAAAAGDRVAGATAAESAAACDTCGRPAGELRSPRELAEKERTSNDGSRLAWLRVYGDRCPPASSAAGGVADDDRGLDVNPPAPASRERRRNAAGLPPRRTRTPAVPAPAPPRGVGGLLALASSAPASLLLSRPAPPPK